MTDAERTILMTCATALMRLLTREGKDPECMSALLSASEAVLPEWNAWKDRAMMDASELSRHPGSSSVLPAAPYTTAPFQSA